MAQRDTSSFQKVRAARGEPSSAQLELRHLRAFVEVVSADNVSRAAERLGVTQSRVSQQLKELETLLDTALFTRAGRRLLLTAAGRLFYDHAVEVLGKLELTVRVVGDSPSGERGHLRIGVVPACDTVFMPAVLGLLHASHPGYTVSVEEGSASDLERDIETGRLDVALGFLSHASPALDYQRLLSDKFALLVRRDHPEAKRTLLPMAELRALDLVLLPGRYFMRQVIDQIMLQNQVRPRIHFEISSLPAVIRTVQEGRLGTILPPFAAPLGDGSNLVSVPLAGVQQALEIGLMRAQGRGRNLPVDHFVEAATKVIESRVIHSAAE